MGGIILSVPGFCRMMHTSPTSQIVAATMLTSPVWRVGLGAWKWILRCSNQPAKKVCIAKDRRGSLGIVQWEGLNFRVYLKIKKALRALISMLWCCISRK